MSLRGVLSPEHMQVPSSSQPQCPPAAPRDCCEQRADALSGLGVDRACRLALGTLRGSALPTVDRGLPLAPPGLQLPARLGPGMHVEASQGL